jgi:hypothetical protein
MLTSAEGQAVNLSEQAAAGSLMKMTSTKSLTQHSIGLGTAVQATAGENLQKASECLKRCQVLFQKRKWNVQHLADTTTTLTSSFSVDNTNLSSTKKKAGALTHRGQIKTLKSIYLEID